MRSGHRSIVFVLSTALAVAPILPACAAMPDERGSAASQPEGRSGPSGEQVSLVRRTTARFLTRAQLSAYETGVDETARYPFAGWVDGNGDKDRNDRKELEKRLRGEADEASRRAGGPGAQAAPALFVALGAYFIEQMLKGIVKGIREKAKEYEAEIAAEALSYSFWNGDRAGPGGTAPAKDKTASGTEFDPKFCAVELRTDAFIQRTEGEESEVDSNPKSVPLQFILYFRPATDAAGNRLFALTPLFFIENDAEARTGKKRLLSAVVEASLDASWTDANNVPHNERIVEESFVISQYTAGLIAEKATSKPRAEIGAVIARGQALASMDDMGHQSRWFALPPQAADRPVALRASIKVTEVDESQARKFLEALAGFLEGHTGKIIDVFNEKVGD